MTHWPAKGQVVVQMILLSRDHWHVADPLASNFIFVLKVECEAMANPILRNIQLLTDLAQHRSG